MILDVWEKIWNLISSLGEKTKTCLIIGLLLFIFFKCTQYSIRYIVESQIEQIILGNRAAEKYTLSVAPQINDCIKTVANKDQECFDVLLLNYHNSTESLQGFKYLYLNCISEQSASQEYTSVKIFWHNLEYIEYEDELSRIHNFGYLRVDSIGSIKTLYPKLCRLVELSDAKSAAIYPINGIESPIGLLVVLYKHTKVYSLDYYNNVIAPSIEKLAIYLDYPYINKKEN